MEMLFSVSDQRSPAPAASRGGPTATSEGPNFNREQLFFVHTAFLNGGHVQSGAQQKMEVSGRLPLPTSVFNFGVVD